MASFSDNNRATVLFSEIPDHKQIVAINFFWLGFILYIVAYTIATTDTVNWIICNLIQIAGLGMMVPASFFLISMRFETGYLRFFFYLYIIWTIIVVARGIRFDYFFIKEMLLGPDFCVFLYAVPVVMLLPKTAFFYKKLFDTILILAIFFVIYDAIFIKYLLHSSGDNTTSMGMVEHFSQHLSLACGLLLFTFMYRKRKFNIFALLIIGLTFIFAVIRARRGLIFMSFSMLFIAYYFYQIANKTQISNIILSFIAIVLVSFIAVQVYQANKNQRFRLITERISQQTRNEVEQYFYNDVQGMDMIIGRGMYGKYYCPGVTEGVNKISIYRTVIETGYLQVLLNSGVIGLGIMLMIIIPAIIKGFFFSKNMLSKAAAMWVFLFLFYMYPTTITKFSMHYITIWICIGICYSSDIRSISEECLRQSFLDIEKPKSVQQLA